LAPWRSGYAEVCKTFYTGSIPVGASKFIMKSIAVCGSKKYKQEIADFCRELENSGILVFEPSFDEPIMEHTEIHSDYITSKIFKGLTLEHFDWIRKADTCFIYNLHDYVGVSVTLEMAYASALGKPIFALSKKTGDPCRDSLVDKVFPSAEAVVKVLQ
jgi:hypothetical protein